MSQIPSHRVEYTDADAAAPVHFHFLGLVDFDVCHRLQRRLAYEAEGAEDGRVVVLFCEHSPLITVGRGGSRGHIRWTSEQLHMRHLDVQWVSRGGGCVLHAPGQLAVYPIVPLRWHGWTVGAYLRRLQEAVTDTLADVGLRADSCDLEAGVWGRTGQLAAWGVAVRNWTTQLGMYLNVNPRMSDFGFVDVVDPRTTKPGRKSTMGSWFAERGRALTIPQVRAALVPRLAAAFGTPRYHVMTGHPLLTRSRSTWRAAQNRAS